MMVVLAKDKVVQQDGGGCQEGPHQAQEDSGLQAPEQGVCQADPPCQVSLPLSSLGAARLVEDLS